MLNPILSQDEATGREIRAFYKLDKFLNRHLRIVNEIRGGITHFPQIVRGDIGSHPDGNTRATVNQ